MTQNEIKFFKENLLKISVSAYEIFEKSLKKDYLLDYFFNSHGVYTAIKSDSRDNYIVFYFSFDNSFSDVKIINEFIIKIINISKKYENRDIFFNFSGENLFLIEYFRKYFSLKTDSYGFQYKITRSSKDILRIKTEKNYLVSDLKEIQYSNFILKDIAELIDRSFYELDLVENNTGFYSENPDYTFEIIKNAGRNFKLFSFKNELACLYITKENFVSLICVNPKFQGLGFGTFILYRAIENLFKNPERLCGYLNCVEYNKKAQLFYEKNGLIKTSHFKEHTLEKNFSLIV